ncbi:hypothetical protein BKA61DRAFT_661338 [Leptodontidium sp. MPI-SDFR-AT-0119]|nr:hypothetical protein BKA61DRAFT_661338 [Leptodontidium sp. MPI-SDFR-AT-0119]
MQTFDEIEFLANGTDTSPALSLLPNPHDVGSGSAEAGAPGYNEHFAPFNTSVPPTLIDGNTGWLNHSLFPIGNAHDLNAEWLQGYGSASYQHEGFSVHPSTGGDLSPGFQEQIIAMNGLVGPDNGFDMFNVDSFWPFGHQFGDVGFTGTLIQNSAMDCELQWQVGEPFPDQFNLPSSGEVHDGNLPLLAGNSLPISCTQFRCFVTFKRDADRIRRHEAAIHGINQALYLCSVLGCGKDQGRGYTRKDKLTEHLWKKHGNLGYVKRT